MAHVARFSHSFVREFRCPITARAVPSFVNPARPNGTSILSSKAPGMAGTASESALRDFDPTAVPCATLNDHLC